MRRAVFFWCVLSLLAVAEMRAQGFNAFNGRNHPELRWQVAETEHFAIMYPQRLAGIEIEAAPIAEASYRVLSENLGVTFDEKIRIYLSDEDEIANGFAVPLGGGYTNIWVHVNEWATVWTGREKWLRKVIAHELAHIFHFRAVASPPRWLNYLLGDPLPRFWTEGLAQYQTEAWDAERGDRWLRTAVLDDQLSYDDGRSIWNGRLLYAVGNAQVRYFADRYGDSTLVDLLAHRKPVLLGLARVHDFDAAFEDVTGDSYRDFYDDWRRHVNIYYNTLAGHLEPVDSLGVEPLEVPGQYLYDVQYSPDTARVAVLSLSSLNRPVRRLYVKDRESDDVKIVAEGAIKAPVAWSPDGQRLAFARTTRGRYGSLLNDLYLVEADGRHLRRLTHSRRASSPAFAPDGQRLAFVGSEAGTANVFILDLATGDETQLTTYTGDVQISSLRWQPSGNHLVFARIDPLGARTLALLDVQTGQLRRLTDGTHDDRQPVWSPDGTRLAYTSLRDEVPNVFVDDPADSTHRRVTDLMTGATIHDWLPPDSAHAEGTLIIVSNVSKQRDRAYRVDALRTASAPARRSVPERYARWTWHRPPHEVPQSLASNPALISNRYPYRSWHNLTHVISGVAPYLASTDDWGLGGGTVWIEPLGKHLLVAGLGLSIADPVGKSFWLGSYVNNQFNPSIALTAYRLPGSSRVYEKGVLVEDLLGGDVTMRWPLDWSDQPFVAEAFSVRLRYAHIEPLNLDVFDELEHLPTPEAGQQAEVRVSYARFKQRPYRYNVVHPLDGTGLRLRVTGAAAVLGADTEFVRGDLQAFGILRGLGLQRLYLYGRAQAQMGHPLPQDFIGFPRTDDVQIDLPGFIPLSLGDTDRVRGYRRFAVGNRVLFGTAEYRVPLLSDLQTRLLGLVSFGATTVAAFVDAGLVWTDGAFNNAEQRLGVGLELKNELRLGGFFSFTHAVGLAQPAEDLGTDANYEVYYRIRTAIPF